jgi:hypothetical protein
VRQSKLPRITHFLEDADEEIGQERKKKARTPTDWRVKRDNSGQGMKSREITHGLEIA